MTATLEREDTTLVGVLLREYPTWTPVPVKLRRTTPAFCHRCDQPWRLPFGPGGELCTPCMAAELADRQIGQTAR